MPAAGPPAEAPAEGCRRRPACPSSSTSKSRPAFPGREGGRVGRRGSFSLPGGGAPLPSPAPRLTAGRAEGRPGTGPGPAVPRGAEPSRAPAAWCAGRALMRTTYPPEGRHRSRFPAEVFCPKSRSCPFPESSPRHRGSSGPGSVPPRSSVGKVFLAFPWWGTAAPLPGAGAASGRAWSKGALLVPAAIASLLNCHRKSNLCTRGRLINQGYGANGVLLFRFSMRKERGKSTFAIRMQRCEPFFPGEMGSLKTNHMLHN